MATQLIQNAFANTYKDDYSDSDNYYKVLFNNGRALQQRELNQMQTIIQTDLKTNSDFSFRHGSAASGGGISCQNEKAFIKLASTSGLPTDNTLVPPAVTQASAETIEGIIFTQATTAIKFRVDKVTIAAGSDPAVIYVTYIDNASVDGTTTGIKITPGNTFTGTDNTVLTSQLTNSTADPAIGFGTLLTVAPGRFYLEGHFVFTAQQKLVISKFSGTPDAIIGFNVSEQIITSSDDTSLFDNSGATLNLSSPGADRYRIKLTLIDKANIQSGDYFIPIAEIVDGKITKQEGTTPASSGLEKMLARRTKDESGSYIVGSMLTSFKSNANDDTELDMITAAGTAYVNGYRSTTTGPTRITFPKPRTTKTENNTASAVSFGNYVTITTLRGVPPINTLGVVNLRNAITHGGSTIGAARIRAIEKDGSNFRFYLFDIIMASGKNFGAVKSIGTSTVIYGDVDRTNTGVVNADGSGEGTFDIALLRDQTNNNLFFPVSKDRPDTISDVVLIVQRILTGTASGTNLTIAASTLGGDHTFTNVSDWFVTLDSSGVVDPNATFTLTSNGASITIANLTSGAAHTVVAYAQVTRGDATDAVGASTSVIAKTLTTVAPADKTPSSGVISLGKTDIFDITSIKDAADDGDISDRYILDNGQRDNFYDLGTLTLKAGAIAPAGAVEVGFRYFEHAANGDFFSKNSYDGQVEYEDIPFYRQANGQTVQLRDVLDFRSVRATEGANFHTGTSDKVVRLPKNNALITYDLKYFLGQKAISYIGSDGKIGIEFGAADDNPEYPVISPDKMKTARVHLFPYMLNGNDCFVEHLDNRRYTMRDIGAIEKRVDQLQEMTALNMLELETNSISVFDSAGNIRLKAGITADNFKNHAQSDTGLSDYRASIDPPRTELRSKFVARAIGLVYNSAASSNTVLIGDKVMLAYSETVYQTQDNASRAIAVNPFGSERITGTLKLSPESDAWKEVNITSVNIVPGDTSFSLEDGQVFGDWDFNWSGISEDEATQFKTGDIIGERIINGGTYTTNNGNTTNTYQKRTNQAYSVSGISTVRSVIGEKILDEYSIDHMRSRFLSFKCTGLRANAQIFGFFDGINVSAFMNTAAGLGGYATCGTLDATSPYREVDNIYSTATTYPSILGGATAKMVTDANGSISGYFLLPRTSTIKFAAGLKIFTLLDISVYRPEVATTIAEFRYEASGQMKEIDQTILETRNVQYASASSQLASRLIGSLVDNAENDGPDYVDKFGNPTDQPNKAREVTQFQKGGKIDKTPVQGMTSGPPARGGHGRSGGGGGSANGGPDFSGGDSYSGGGCFIKGTMIEMADGTEKEITSIVTGDETRGGKVIAKVTFGDHHIWDYKGIKVSGSQWVMEDGQFTSVETSRHGIPTDMIEPVNTMLTTEGRIFIKGVEFGAYYAGLLDLPEVDEFMESYKDRLKPKMQQINI